MPVGGPGRGPVPAPARGSAPTPAPAVEPNPGSSVCPLPTVRLGQSLNLADRVVESDAYRRNRLDAVLTATAWVVAVVALAVLVAGPVAALTALARLVDAVGR